MEKAYGSRLMRGRVAVTGLVAFLLKTPLVAPTSYMRGNSMEDDLWRRGGRVLGHRLDWSDVLFPVNCRTKCQTLCSTSGTYVRHRLVDLNRYNISLDIS